MRPNYGSRVVSAFVAACAAISRQIFPLVFLAGESTVTRRRGIRTGSSTASVRHAAFWLWHAELGSRGRGLAGARCLPLELGGLSALIIVPGF